MLSAKRKEDPLSNSFKRVPIKGDRDRFEPALTCRCGQIGHDLRVTNVHTVELADRDSGVAVTSNFVKSHDFLVCFLESPTRAPQSGAQVE